MTQLDSKPGRLTMLSGLLAVTCLLYASASASAASLEVFIRHSFDGEPLLLDSLRYRKGSEEAKGLSYHLARNPNRAPITVAARIDLTQDARLQIDFDLAHLLNGPRSADFSPLQRPNPEGAPQFQESDGNRPVKRTE